MSRIIITDSTSYLPQSIIDKYDIKIIPLNVHLPDKVFKEGVGLTNQEYYHRLKTEKIFPHTSQPSPADFLEQFNQLQTGDEAIVITISSLLSGTVQAAALARDMTDNKDIGITVIDSNSTIIGLGFQVIKACEMASQNQPITAIRDEIIRIQQKLKGFFIVDDLEYLVRGGRVSHVKGFIGNVLKMKPILTLTDGQINLYENVRTRQKALSVILDKLAYDQNHLEQVSVVHVDAPNEVQELACEVAKITSLPILVTEVGPVIGTHVGPGSVGVFYY